MNTHTALKTLEEFITFYEKGDDEKMFLFKQYEFAVKERQRLREKDKKYYQVKKAEKALLPPVPKKKRGPKGPWKHKDITSPSTDSSPQQ